MTYYPGPPPPELASAIQAACSRYGIPVDVLTGIWRIETGSNFPNPYVNSSGYGGLFGTTHWNTSTQDQAFYAASILARLLREHNGDMGAALLAYSGSAYSTVPGEIGTHGGTPPPPGATPPPGSTEPAPVTRPGGQPQTASVVSGVGDVFSGVFGKLFGVAKELPEAAWSIAKSIAFLIHFVTSPDNWLRLVEFLAGVGLVVFALAVFGKVLGGADSEPARVAGRLARSGGGE